MSLDVRNKIIADLFTSKEFNDCIHKMQPVELQDDLRAEVALILCEHGDKVISIHNSGPMALKFYTVRIILNLIQSKTSPFYKKYRQPICEFSDTHERPDISEEEHDKRLLYELKEEKVLKIVDEMFWYDREMLRLYMELGNYRQMQKATSIPWASCYDTIQSVYAKIRYELRRQPS